MTIIKVQNLRKRFGSHLAVKNLSLEVQKGEVFGFLGPNGCGKTTTIRMLCGLLKPDAGHGVCLDYDIMTQADKISLKVGYMPQHFCYYKMLTVKENLMFIAKLYGVSKKRVNHLIEEFGLMNYENHLTGKLSGGWKQRVSLAASIMNDPDLLLLDEPTASVDPTARREFWSMIHSMAKQGKSILVSTHYMDEAERCTRLAFMLDGEIKNSGSQSDIIKASGLKTIKVLSPDAINLKVTLKKSIENDFIKVSLFGNAVHISSNKVNELQLVYEKLLQDGHHCEWLEASVEDVFIHYVC